MEERKDMIDHLTLYNHMSIYYPYRLRRCAGNDTGQPGKACMEDDDMDMLYGLIARRLKAMAEPSRLRLLGLLAESSMNVGELVEASGQSQAGVSKHLRILRQEGLVTSSRRSRMVYYSLRSDVTREICDLVCRSIEENLDGGREMLGNYWKAANE